MACQTCDHTMQRVNAGEPPTFWCSRCGTLYTLGMVPEYEPPRIVERTRRLYETIRAVEADEFINIDALDAPVRSVVECFKQMPIP